MRSLFHAALQLPWGQKPKNDRFGALKAFFEFVQELLAAKKMLAYHDRSDGGLLTTLVEMAFAGHCGLAIDIQALGGWTDNGWTGTLPAA